MSRWEGIKRDYTPAEVEKLRGSVRIEYSLARNGAIRLWKELNDSADENWVAALGALTGNQAVQQVKAGLKAIYLSGWQVAADANLSGHMYPDQSLYPANSVPHVVKRINQALQRADQVESVEGNITRDWMAPIVADAEAGFGGPLNVYELMKAMIESGAAGVHFEDQLSSEKKCGHLGGKVLIPTNIDPYDHTFMTGERTSEGCYRITGGIDQAISRGLAYASYADLIWCETSTPNIEEARKFANAIHEKYPGKLLAYNCSPSFNWSKHLRPEEISTFQADLSALGYTFQFVTLAGFHALNYSMFELARQYRDSGMSAYVDLQNAEFMSEHYGYTATKHQREVGTGYFDEVKNVITSGNASTLALTESTESEQF